MFEQRVATDESAHSASEGVWIPDEWAERIEPGESDWYAVVDELMDGTAVVAYAPWPHLDEVGRLHFGEAATDSRHALGISEERLQALVDEARRASSESDDPAVVERPLRVGDAFLVRRIEDGEEPVLDIAVDVTTYARAAAKKALYAAVAPRVTPAEAEALELSAGDERAGPPDPPPPGPATAAPAV